MDSEIDFKFVSDVEVPLNNSLHLPKITSNISYSDFFKQYLLPNKPCILTNISSEWPCTKEWLINKAPNFDYLSQKYESYEVTISDCNKRNFNSHSTNCSNFLDYCTYWKEYIENNYPPNMSLLYLKDWHLRKKSGEQFYRAPKYFCSDWLNEYFSEKTNDDYKFVYMGPKGTWTPFHADVFTSFSWSVNICGKKKWMLFPPGNEQHLKDHLGNLPYDVTKINKNTDYIEVIQEAGEAIFVPSKWHHQVWNLEDTISINHNWVNGCNVLNMWESLVENLNLVKKEIEDCKGMDGWLTHCQLMLKTSYGIDFEMFYYFLHYIANKRFKLLIYDTEIKQFDLWSLGKNHAIFDLDRIKDILELLTKHSDFHEICFIDVPQPDKLLLDIYDIIKNNK